MRLGPNHHHVLPTKCPRSPSALESLCVPRLFRDHIYRCAYLLDDIYIRRARHPCSPMSAIHLMFHPGGSRADLAIDALFPDYGNIEGYEHDAPHSPPRLPHDSGREVGHPVIPPCDGQALRSLATRGTSRPKAHRFGGCSRTLEIPTTPRPIVHTGPTDDQTMDAANAGWQDRWSANPLIASSAKLWGLEPLTPRQKMPGQRADEGRPPQVNSRFKTVRAISGPKLTSMW